jgi:hypothetical protein
MGREPGRLGETLAMQKVVGSSPIIRSLRKPRGGGVFAFKGPKYAVCIAPRVRMQSGMAQPCDDTSAG